MHKRRLKTLSTFLSETKFESGKFHLGMWMGTYEAFSERVNIGDNDPTMKAVRRRLEKLEDAPNFDITRGVYNALPVTCRTVGCAMGWAATIPSFRKAGLKLRYEKGARGDADSFATPVYEFTSGYNAIELFFDIDYQAIRILFSPQHYPRKQWRDPKAVAKRINELLEKGERDFIAKY